MNVQQRGYHREKASAVADPSALAHASTASDRRRAFARRWRGGKTYIVVVKRVYTDSPSRLKLSRAARKRWAIAVRSPGARAREWIAVCSSVPGARCGRVAARPRARRADVRE